MVTIGLNETIAKVLHLLSILLKEWAVRVGTSDSFGYIHLKREMWGACCGRGWLSLALVALSKLLHWL